jgi:hypothetical protein
MAASLDIKITADNKQALEGLQQTTTAANQLGNSFNKLPNASNQANQALVNSGRVLQDLNYGFVGIANNLNPLLESFQRLGEKAKESGTSVKKELISALTGPAGIGVALSLATFLFLKFGDEISNFISKVVSGNDVLKSQKEALAGIGDEFKTAVEKVDKVSIAFQEYHNKIITGNEALKIYNTELGKNFGVKSDINEAEKTFKDKTAAYVEASFQRALADSASKKAAEELLKLRLAQGKAPSEYSSFADFLLKTGGFISGADPSEGIKNAQINRRQKDIDDIQKIIDQYRAIALNAQSVADLFAKGFNFDLTPDKTKKPKVEKEFDYVTAIKKRSVLSGQDTMEAVKEDTTIKDMEKSHQEHLNWLSKWYKFKMDLARKSGEENKKVLEDQQKSYESFAKQLSGSVVNALQGVYDAMQKGDSFGKAFLDMLGKITEQLIAMVIQTLIFRAIMAALTGGGSEVGIAASNVAGSAGRILMIPKYAEGGIVNKPHIGMVGEAGPEAIIPLNKLSGFLNTTFNAGAMSGGGAMAGGGSFVLKGNDLVLALQRSNHSLNLRRGI